VEGLRARRHDDANALPMGSASDDREQPGAHRENGSVSRCDIIVFLGKPVIMRERYDASISTATKKCGTRHA
jgi:hypothetical protein